MLVESKSITRTRHVFIENTLDLFTSGNYGFPSEKINLRKKVRKMTGKFESRNKQVYLKNRMFGEILFGTESVTRNISNEYGLYTAV